MYNYNTLNDIELINLLAIDDEKAFTEIYNRYWNRLFAIAFNKLRDLNEAEEIVQDIFVSLWKRRKVLEITDTLSAYLAVSVKYRVIKLLNKQNNQQQYIAHTGNVVSMCDDSTQQWIEFEELKNQLAVYVASLPEKCRLVYQMSRDQGFTHKKIASELGIAEKTVEAHLTKAVKILRARLSQILL
ncbi:RNA polymerase sigma-70 factor [Mucilaginibacter aquaedulcis]|uniref:RNA polymerase sigma-70 factor n=1 Tax=Mucilaginibacter aquaedulcis TaxID=1187081 RepID=UPI0025B5BAD7|nr:RNA polymerase sigma-70 factor [Mucilaginibacter aquaedulcis]MDN3549209.1 RNA polymerase sigma-70 factor [Mucilaginibacter aquaedulcis]